MGELAAAPYCLFEDRESGESLFFTAPRRIIAAHRPDELAGAFAAMQEASRAGLHLAGFCAYELGYALEPRLAPLLPQTGRPLLLFGAFDAPMAPPRVTAGGRIIDLRPAWSFDQYRRRFEICQNYITAGDVYQINLTFPIFGRAESDPLALYQLLRARQPVETGGVFAFGGECILSLSPEKFFSTRGAAISTRPMKGTAPRAENPAQDSERARALAADEKNRAENLMIVDLLRNDLSRLSEVGSVRVPKLYTVETYPTLHQMTSEVEARLRPDVALAELFAGLFPCGSVTGAPKIRAMEIIAELESAPRGNYCGAFGHIAPNGDMRFNVAIRTLTLDGRGGMVCPVGSAIVADSLVEKEYEECLLKARFLTGAAISA